MELRGHHETLQHVGGNLLGEGALAAGAIEADDEPKADHVVALGAFKIGDVLDAHAALGVDVGCAEHTADQGRAENPEDASRVHVRSFSWLATLRRSVLDITLLRSVANRM